jgi:hypothetical protein
VQPAGVGAERAVQQGSGAAGRFTAEQRLAGQLVDAHAGPVRPRMVGAHDHDQGFVPPRRGLEPGPLVPPFGERDVDDPGAELVEDLAVGAHPVPDAVAPGVRVADRLDHRLEQVDADVRGGADDQLGIAEQPGRPVGELQQGAGVALERRARRRGDTAGGSALDQAGPQLGLQAADVLGHGALSDAEPRRRRAEPAGVEHRDPDRSRPGRGVLGGVFEREHVRRVPTPAGRPAAPRRRRSRRRPSRARR